MGDIMQHRYLTNDLDAAGLPTWAASDEPLTFYDPVTGKFWEHEADDTQMGAEMAVRVVTTPHGIFRAVVRDDLYPDAPDYEAGCPVFRVSRHRDYTGVQLEDKPEVGEDSWRHDGLETHELHEAVDKFAHDHGRDNLDVTDRWLRIFHGGSLKVLTSGTYQGGDNYITYDTRAMRAHWGQTGEMLETTDPEADEWQAYLDGEVYSVAVERLVDGEWAEVEGPVYGYYGDYAFEAAEDELHSTIAHHAGQMLPMGGE